MSSSAVRRAATHAVDDSLTSYLEEIRRFPLVDRQTETALAARIRSGDRDAIDQLVCANLRFVVSVAKRYQNYGIPLVDLINEGNVGLLRAAERFDDTRGVRFISYAVWWIRQAIAQAVARHSQAVSLPVNRPKGHRIRTLSLDEPGYGGEEQSLLDRLVDTRVPAPDEHVTEEALVESIDDALHDLHGREEHVLRLYFGFDGNEPMTLEAIGAQLGVTRERVRQIKERALSRLRKGRASRHLAPFHIHHGEARPP